MNVDRLFIASVLSLGIGLAILFGYCHGTTGFNAAYPFAGASFQISLVTTGLPAMLGFALTMIGLLMLIVAAVSSVMREVESHSETARGRERTAA